MTTREERKLIKSIIKTLKENKEIADKDYEKTDSPVDAGYYAGLSDACDFCLELIRQLKT